MPNQKLSVEDARQAFVILRRVPLSAEDLGWETDRERRIMVEGFTAVPLSFSPLWSSFVRVLANRPGLTALQPALVDERRWHRSEMYDR